MKTLLKTNHTEVFEVNGIEMIKRPVTAAILAIDTYGDIIMVEQERGSFGVTLEVPAGKVDKGEDSKTAVLRELLEETGYTANSCKKLISYYPSVGYSTEQIDCYFTDDLSNIMMEQRLDDNERVTVRKMSPEKIWKMIDEGLIKDSKTIMCMFAYERYE